ncbi:MAG: glycoside hydrolase family 3 protein [Verrucomicrobia bacterium]|nr:MAG: glycoside hydrolase family 3 protein [Verrucomicrobiota bacterium]
MLFRDSHAPLVERVEDLLGRLTMEEKAGIMQHEARGVPRLGIPDYNWWSEALHGVGRASRATVFPQAIGMAATFDHDLLRAVASAIGDEGRAIHHEAARHGQRGQNFGLTFWSPNINIFRDPRWGRGQETYGEDPTLTARMGVAFVEGLQGDHPKYLKAAACAKHYAVHSGPESERHTFDVKIPAHDLWDTYLPAFEALVKAGVEAVMGAYNRVNGEPCCAHTVLIEEVLRQRWKFEGHFVSDCWAIRDFHQTHRVSTGPLEACALAVRKGCDLNCGSTYELIPEAIKEGHLTEEDLDPCVRRLLRTWFRLGFFDPAEEVPFTSIGPEVINCDRHRALALETAEKSIVLLKNEENLLPLQDVRSILVVGTLAANIDVLLGNYYGVSGNATTLLEGIARHAPVHTQTQYRAGFRPEIPNVNPIDYAQTEAGQSDVVIAAFGLTPWLEGEEGEALASGEKGDRPDPGLPEHQIAYLRSLKERDCRIIGVLFGGSPIVLGEATELCDALLWVGYPGEAGGEAIARILFGLTAPSGKLPFTLYKHIDDLPPFNDYGMRGRTYRYLETEPEFPFGFGRTYTTFSLEGMSVSTDRVGDDPIQVSVDLVNTGSTDGEEIVQLYVRAKNPPFHAPKLALKDFKRVVVPSGQNRKVEFSVDPEALKLVDPDGNRVLPTGEYELIIATAAPGQRAGELGTPAIQSALVMIKPSQDVI